jgi:hypothetical protein
MFQRFEDTIQKLTSGTIGYFCMRCHAPVATIMKHPRDQAIYDGPRVFREGVTCVACHRVREAYTKSNGERRIESGTFFNRYGGGDGSGNERHSVQGLLQSQTSALDTFARGSTHGDSSSSFCKVTLHELLPRRGSSWNKLEVVWDQYRASPAYRVSYVPRLSHGNRPE